RMRSRSKRVGAGDTGEDTRSRSGKSRSSRTGELRLSGHFGRIEPQPEGGRRESHRESIFRRLADGARDGREGHQLEERLRTLVLDERAEAERGRNRERVERDPHSRAPDRERSRLRVVDLADCGGIDVSALCARRSERVGASKSIGPGSEDVAEGY